MTPNTEIDDGGSAFPSEPVNHGYSPEASGEGTGSGPGMSLRDWLAAHASEHDIRRIMSDSEETLPPLHITRPTLSPEQARYRFADLMIAARKGGV